MAASTYNTVVVFNGTKRLALMFSPKTIDEQTPILIDASAYNATSFTINKITYECSGCSLLLSEDASTDVELMRFNGLSTTSVWGKFDFDKYGGIKNSKASGYTGDLIITPANMATGDSFTFYIELEKNT